MPNGKMGEIIRELNRSGLESFSERHHIEN
jgi:hypothetical protein